MAVVDVDKRHQDLVDELIAAVEAYYPGVDKELVARAFHYAAAAHAGQQRRSGEPFVQHPWATAKICAQLRLDDQAIAAALLHDVVEDSAVVLDELRAEFGDEIAQLVEGVTKLTRTSFQSREQAEAENYRKMIVTSTISAAAIAAHTTIRPTGYHSTAAGSGPGAGRASSTR